MLRAKKGNNMENEKKKGEPQSKPHHDRKNRPHRPRGYFIEPAKASNGNAPSAAASKPEVKKDEQRENGNRHPNPPKKDVPAQNQENRVPSSTNGGDRAEHIQGKNGNNRNRRRRNRSHAKDKKANPAEQRHEGINEEQAISTPKQEAKEQSDERRDNRGGRDNNRRGKSAPRTEDKLRRDIQIKKPSSDFPDEEYEEVHFPVDDEPVIAESPKEPAIAENIPTVEVVGIRFKSTGKIYYFEPNGKQARRGEHAIVDTARGLEYGEVAMGNTHVKETEIVPPLRSIVRIATEADIRHHCENKKKEEDAFRLCNERIASHGLDMKLIDAQYTFDNSKLLFYFTSAGRVDFRELVKDLASVFRTRIELRQIGIRDEAKLMGGMGMCGRPLCCSLFLSDFGQVSIKMAKEQNLSLNSAKISGICGRLMCCLRYEHETYEYEIKRTPPVDSLVRTADGNGYVTEISPLVGTVKVRLIATPDTPPKVYRREDVTMLQKKQKQEKQSENK